MSRTNKNAPEGNQTLGGGAGDTNLQQQPSEYSSKEPRQELLAFIERAGGRDFRVLVDRGNVEQPFQLRYFRTDPASGNRVGTCFGLGLSIEEALDLGCALRMGAEDMIREHLRGRS